MSDWVVTSWSSLLMVFISAVVTYGAIITLTRLSGIRSFSKLSGFDFAVTVATGSVLASIFVAKDPPLLQGLFALLVLYTLQMSLAFARKRIRAVESLVDNRPRLIMSGAVVHEDQMKKSKITLDDLYAKLREANVTQFDQIFAVVAETTGDISVLHGAPENHLNPDLLRNVIGAERFEARPSVDSSVAV